MKWNAVKYKEVKQSDVKPERWQAECSGEFKGVVNVKWSGVGGRVVREDVGRDAVK